MSPCVEPHWLEVGESTWSYIILERRMDQALSVGIGEANSMKLSILVLFNGIVR